MTIKPVRYVPARTVLRRFRKAVKAHMQALERQHQGWPAYGTMDGIRHEQWGDALRWLDEIERGDKS